MDRKLRNDGYNKNNKKMWETIASAGGDLLGSVVNNIFASKQAKKERAFNRQMADQAYMRDVDMWNRQNEYNTPEAQMERLKSAGLNPALMYGQGTVGNATGAPKAEVPSGRYAWSPILVPDLVEKYQDIRLKKLQGDQVSMAINNAKANLLMTRILSNIKAKELELWNPIRSAYGYQEGKSYYERRKMEQEEINRDQQAKEANARMQLMDKKGFLLDRQDKWMETWMREYEQTGVNPNRDPLLDRVIQKSFGNTGTIMNMLLGETLKFIPRFGR